MMGILTDILSGKNDELVSNISQVADQFIASDEERYAFKTQMTALIQQRESELEQKLFTDNQAKRDSFSQAGNRDDKFTKRARPMLVYFGLVMIAVNYMLFPILARLTSMELTPLPDLPWEFWAGWSGIVATWSIGRSAEKIGTSNKVTRMITGQKDSGAVG